MNLPFSWTRRIRVAMSPPRSRGSAARGNLRAAVERLEDRLAPAGLVNGDFSVAHPSDPGFGWSTAGSASVANGEGVLAEVANVQSEFSQTFTIPANTTALRFTIVGSGFVGNGGANPPDFFEAALLNATTQASLVGPPTGLTDTDSFLNVQQSGEVFYAPQVTVPGAGASGSVSVLQYPELVTVDLTAVPANTQATLFFDLIGFGPASSSVRIDNVTVLQGPAPPPLSFVIDPATDSGVVGDDLTRFNTINVLGATEPGQVVSLSINSTGFNDGMISADASGHFGFNGLTLAEGTNTIRVQAINAQGSSVAARTITIDTQPPTATLVTPAPNSATSQDVGYVDMQWTDPGAAGLGPTAFSPTNISITGVSIDRVDDLGGGLERYVYNLDGDHLQNGPVNIAVLANQVADRAANVNASQSWSFTFGPGAGPAPHAADDAYRVDAGTTLSVPAPGVLGNDTSPAGHPLSAVLVTAPAHGSLALQADGSFTFTPAVGYDGPDSFTYQATDGSASSNVATVAISVAPVARDDAYTTMQNRRLSVIAPGVLANDHAPGLAVLVAGPSRGTLTFRGDGSFTYTPAANVTGSDSFTYQIRSGSLAGDLAIVHLTITPCPTLLLPTTRHYNALRRQWSRNPPRFDAHRSTLGAFIELEHTSIPTAPTLLLPTTTRFNALRARRAQDPTRFDARQRTLAALFQLEAPPPGPPPTHLLPVTSRLNALRTRFERNRARFDRKQTNLGAIFALEDIENGCVSTVQVLTAGPPPDLIA